MKSCAALFTMIFTFIVLILTVMAASSSNSTRNSHRRPKIVSGYPVAPGELPYSVSIQSNNIHWCGGSIISSWHILSAAHCFIDTDNLFYDETTKGPLTIKAGTTDLSDPLNYVYAEIGEIVISNYFFNSHDKHYIYDFAVIKLKNQLDLINNPKVRSIQLPNFDPYRTYDGQYATVSGFGDTYYPGTNKTYSPDIMYEVDVQIWSINYCNHLFNGQKILDLNHICGYVPRNDSTLRGPCSGDSGDPLAYQHTLIGIVSFGPTICGEKDKPNTFTKVASWLPFIHAIMDGRYDIDMAIKRF